MAFLFLLTLPCERFLLLGSPALQYAGTDRLQIVGVGSLLVESPLVEDTSPCWNSVQCQDDSARPSVQQRKKPAEERRTKLSSWNVVEKLM